MYSTTASTAEARRETSIKEGEEGQTRIYCFASGATHRSHAHATHAGPRSPSPCWGHGHDAAGEWDECHAPDASGKTTVHMSRSLQLSSL